MSGIAVVLFDGYYLSSITIVVRDNVKEATLRISQRLDDEEEDQVGPVNMKLKVAP